MRYFVLVLIALVSSFACTGAAGKGHHPQPLSRSCYGYREFQ